VHDLHHQQINLIYPCDFKSDYNKIQSVFNDLEVIID